MPKVDLYGGYEIYSSFALKVLKKRVAASKKGVQAADEAYIPSLVTKGNYTLS